ncbi:single-stranded DNA-binding protein [soil metagenome]
MASYNKVMLMGNLTRDPEVRYTPKGSAVADLAIAVNRVYTADNGEKREEVTYVDVVLWARLAELAGQYLSKGRPVFIEGRLQMDSWEDKQTGQKRSRLRVVGEVMQFLDGKRDGGGEEHSAASGGGGSSSSTSQRPPMRSSGNAGGQSRPPASRQSQPATDEFHEGPITDGLDDDDIPF